MESLVSFSVVVAVVVVVQMLLLYKVLLGMIL